MAHFSASNLTYPGRNISDRGCLQQPGIGTLAGRASEPSPASRVPPADAEDFFRDSADVSARPEVVNTRKRFAARLRPTPRPPARVSVEPARSSIAGAATGPRPRVAVLDALRGILALLVVFRHVAVVFYDSDRLIQGARVAVLLFFVMSGYVLTRAYDGRAAVFVARRLLRLWPLYFICLAAGHVLLGVPWHLGEVIWYPSELRSPPAANPPSWTLYMEAWATLFLLPLFAVARLDRGLAWFSPVLCLPLAALEPRLCFLPLFALGVALAGTRLPLRLPPPPGWSLWLGKISFSLYLCHWTVLSLCHALFGGGVVVAGVGVAASLAVAWVLWRIVEVPSIAMSKTLGAKQGTMRAGNTCEPAAALP